MSEKQHAEVKQEHRDAAQAAYDEWRSFHNEPTEQLGFDGKRRVDYPDMGSLVSEEKFVEIVSSLAAEVERKARLDEHDSLCVECSYVRLNGKGGLTQRCSRGAELRERANGKKQSGRATAERSDAPIEVNYRDGTVEYCAVAPSAEPSATDGLTTDDEYAELAQDHAAVKRLEDYDAAIAAVRARPTESMEEIAKLANFILEEVPGEPSAGESAVDVAIRLLRARARPTLTHKDIAKSMSPAHCEHQTVAFGPCYDCRADRLNAILQSKAGDL